MQTSGRGDAADVDDSRGVMYSSQSRSGRMQAMWFIGGEDAVERKVGGLAAKNGSLGWASCAAGFDINRITRKASSPRS